MNSENILIENAKEYWRNALLAEERNEFNTAVTLFYKTLSALADIYILRKEKQIPTSQADRFRILETKHPNIYQILDKDFPFYQDSYRSKLDMSEIVMSTLWASAQSNQAISEHAQKLRNTLRTLVRSF